MSNENPYSSPIVEPSESPAAEPAVVSDSIWPVAKRTFLAWEKLRLVYNAILIVMSVAYAVAWSLLFAVEFWVISFIGAIVCNVCFMLGPIIETYVAWLGYRTQELRLVFFIAGTFATAAIALLTLTSLFQAVTS